jgi:hypothetical protein
MFYLAAMIWKVWTGFLLLGAALEWWSFTWGLALFFLPDAMVFCFLVVAGYEGRRIRKAEERAAKRS